MKQVLSLTLILTAVLTGIAHGDDQVPRSTLKQLGLTDLVVLSDQEASQIRGSAGTVAMGASNVTGLVIDPLTKSFIFGTDANAAMATGDKHATQSQQSNVNVSLTVGAFHGFLIGGAGGSSGAWHR